MPSDFQLNLLILGGPACGALALLFFAFRRTHPATMGKWISAVAMATVIPPVAVVVLTYFFGPTHPLAGVIGMTAFTIRPMIAVVAGFLAIDYFSRRRSRRLPLLSALPAGLMLAGAGLDLYSVPVLILYAGASC